jgi:hypothetical protein
LINRSQALVLLFFGAALISVFVILAASPAVLRSTLEPLGKGPAVEVAFAAGLTGFLAVAAMGVIRRWRWVFWLIVAAFLAGILRVPATFLELGGVLPKQGPDWYLLLQAGIGLVQVVIGALLIKGYRRGGVWGAF